MMVEHQLVLPVGGTYTIKTVILKELNFGNFIVTLLIELEIFILEKGMFQHKTKLTKLLAFCKTYDPQNSSHIIIMMSTDSLLACNY